MVIGKIKKSPTKIKFLKIYFYFFKKILTKLKKYDNIIKNKKGEKS